MKKMLNILVVSAIFAIATISAGQTGDPQPPQQPDVQATTLLDVINLDNRFRTFSRWIKISGIDETLKPKTATEVGGDGGTMPTPSPTPVAYTIFAPTDEAIAKLPKATVDAIEKDKDLLKKIVSNHIVKSRLEPTDLMDSVKLKSLLGEDLVLHVTSDTTKINDATFDKSGVKSSNGLVYVVDQVLMPTSLASAKGISSGGR